MVKVNHQEIWDDSFFPLCDRLAIVAEVVLHKGGKIISVAILERGNMVYGTVIWTEEA